MNRPVIALLLVLTASISSTSSYAQTEASAAAGRDCAECPEMVAIPPGTFQMGSTAEEQGRFGLSEDDERPVHEVQIRYAFSVSQSPITRAEWKRFVSATSHADRSDCQKGQQDDHPVVCVSWQDAQDYAAWLTEKSGGKPYRLLSEAEYEYVGRAGTSTAYWWGDSFSTSGANNLAHRGTTTAVRSYPANPFGLYDTTGNAYSWTQDCYHKNYNGAPTDGSAWDGGPNCSAERVERGGCWAGPHGWVRSASRFRGTGGWSCGGFRVAKTLD